MSSPRLPAEIASTSIVSRLPSFIAEPLPNARSIWASAASSARALSPAALSSAFEIAPTPSTTFRLAAIVALPSGRFTPLQGDFRTTDVLKEQEANELRSGGL